jgi:hypothetical protein
VGEHAGRDVEASTQREREGQTATMQQEMEMEEARDARWDERRGMMR